MDDDLRYLVHFFHDERHLFETLTMADVADRDAICDAIASRKGWFWVRFSSRERQAYLTRRVFVEKTMYDAYQREHGRLKEHVPVSFYLIPRMTALKAGSMARRRAELGEAEPKVLIARLDDIDDTSNMTFTLNDSHTSYWRAMKDARLEFGGEVGSPAVLPDHGRVFPFSMIGRIHERYRAQGVPYEVQVWDHELLEGLRYRILDPGGA